MGFGKVGREKFHPFYGSSPGRSSTRRGGRRGIPLLFFLLHRSLLHRSLSQGIRPDFYRPTLLPPLSSIVAISVRDIDGLSPVNSLLSIGNAYSCIKMEMLRFTLYVSLSIYIYFSLLFFPTFLQLIRKVGRRQVHKFWFLIGRLRFNYRAFNVLGVSRDYQNPSPLLTFAYLGSLNRVIFDGSYFSSRRASLDIRFHVIREFFPRGDCSNVHTATVCVHCVPKDRFLKRFPCRRTMFSLLFFLLFFLLFGSGKKNSRNKREVGTRQEKERFREPRGPRRGAFVGRAWSWKWPFTRGDEKIPPVSRRACSFVFLGDLATFHADLFSLPRANRRIGIVSRKLRESHLRRSTIRRWNVLFFRFLETDHFVAWCFVVHLTLCVLETSSNLLSESFLSIGKHFSR